MHANSAVLAVVLAMVNFAIAGPPACLIAALGQQANPADIKGLCGDNWSAMEGNITHACSGSALAPAYSAYSATCLAAGVTVSALPTTSATGTATGSGSAQPSTTPTGSSTASAASASSTDHKDAAAGLSPQPLLLALTGLFATGITFIFVL